MFPYWAYKGLLNYEYWSKVLNGQLSSLNEDVYSLLRGATLSIHLLDPGSHRQTAEPSVFL